MPEERPHVRYLAAFEFPPEDLQRVSWPDWVPGDAAVYERSVGFFLEPVRPIFATSVGRPNLRGARYLQHPERRARAYLFPGGIGILTLSENPEVSLREAAPYLKRTSGESGERYREARELLATLGCRTQLAVHERRLLTWALWCCPSCSLEEERTLLFSLTEHLAPGGSDGLRPGALDRLCRAQGVERWKAWAALYYRDNAAVLFHPELAGELTPFLLGVHRGNYFRMYLLCLYLKLWLLRMMKQLVPEAEEPARTAPEVEAVWALYDGIRLDYLRFRNHFWFAEVTRDTTGRHLYPRMIRSLGLRPLMREVTEELNILHSQYRRLIEQQRRKERAGLQQRLNVITWYLFPLVIATGLLGMNVIIPGSSVGLAEGLAWFAGALAVTVSAMFLGIWLGRPGR